MTGARAERQPDQGRWPWWPRRTGRTGAIEVLSKGRRVAADLRDGLGRPRVRSAARELRELLEVDQVGLADLSGSVSWSEPSVVADPAEQLVEEVLRTEDAAGRPPLLALPLLVHQELAGVLVVVGQTTPKAAREAGAWVAEALERGRLDASADVAAQAELRALRAEMSPHFVYNTLTTIASFVRSDPGRARDLMLDFAEYTRHSLARHGEYTTVADEFRAIESYLALAKAVLGNRLRVQVRVAPEVLPVAVPYLALQPLVENAIRHGVEPHDRPGLVQVHGVAESEECVISVEDDGPGMMPEFVGDILAGRGNPSSVGLANVDRRLRTVFGASHGLVIETAPGAGTKVVVRLPRFTAGVVAT